LPLWNIVLSGYPGSGKTVLARRVVSENPDFVRLNVDDLRDMFFGRIEPPEEEEFVYSTLSALRDIALRHRHSVILDSTTPKNSTRNLLLNTRVKGVIALLVVVMAEKNELIGRNRERGMEGVVEAWDKAWENPTLMMPVMKFRNNSLAEFETSYYILNEVIRSKFNPYKRRFLGHVYPKI
jgi:predicted kinase